MLFCKLIYKNQPNIHTYLTQLQRTFMFKQIMEIFQPDATRSFCSQKRLNRVYTIPDISSLKFKKFDKLQSQANQSVYLQTPTDISKPKYSEGTTRNRQQSNTKQVNQFLFCLKIKMIGIGRLFQIQKGMELACQNGSKTSLESSSLQRRETFTQIERTDEKIDKQNLQNQDANEILNELTKKIKAYKKNNKNRLIQLQNKNKKLEIQIIQLQSQIKLLQSDLSHKKNQLQHNTKTHTVDIKKTQSKIRQQQEYTQTLISKIQTVTKLYDEQIKIVTQLQIKLQQYKKDKKQSGKIIFEKQKQIVKLCNQNNLNKKKYQQELDNTKKSLMKKTEEINKLTIQVKSLKQIIQKKQQKLQQSRIRYNKIYNQLERSQAKFKIQAEQNRKTQHIHTQKLKQSQKMLVEFKNKTNQNISKIKIYEQKVKDSLESFKIIEKVDDQFKNVKVQQKNLDKQIDAMIQYMNKQLKSLQQKYIKQIASCKQQFDVQVKLAVSQLRIGYQAKISKLSDYIWQLQRKINAMSSQCMQIGQNQQVLQLMGNSPNNDIAILELPQLQSSNISY